MPERSGARISSRLSGVGPRQPLERVGVPPVHELPGVGANLLDHLAGGLFAHTRGVETLASAESVKNLITWAVRGRGPLTSNVGEAAAFLRTRPQLAAPDLELLFAPVLFEEEGLKQPTEDGLTLATVLLRPKSSGTVELRSSNPLEPPAIDPRYLTDPVAKTGDRRLAPPECSGWPAGSWRRSHSPGSWLPSSFPARRLSPRTRR